MPRDNSLNSEKGCVYSNASIDLTRSVSPERLAQGGFIDLVDARLRQQFAAQIDAARALVACDQWAAMRDDRLSREAVGARACDHDGVHGFAPARVGYSNDGTLRSVGM
jgi:hypothetical protein